MEQVQATATRHRDGIWMLIVSPCPFCGKSHRHGGGDGATPSGGYRLSHCDTRRHEARQYELVLAPTLDDVPPEVEPSAVRVLELATTWADKHTAYVMATERLIPAANMSQLLDELVSVESTLSRAVGHYRRRLAKCTNQQAMGMSV